MAVPRTLTYEGRTQSVAEWANELGIGYETLRYRLKAGWPVKKALSLLKDPRGRLPGCGRLVTYEGRTQSVADWARETGLRLHVIYRRLQAGWPVERVLSVPANGGERTPGDRDITLTFRGQTMTLSGWAKYTGLKSRTLYGRLRKGWSVERTLTTPVPPQPRRKPIFIY